MQVLGLCLGMVVGTAAHAGFFWLLYKSFDWELEAGRAMQRVGLNLGSLQPASCADCASPTLAIDAQVAFTVHTHGMKAGSPACKEALQPLLAESRESYE